MKSKHYSLLIVLAALVLAGCRSDDPSQNPDASSDVSSGEVSSEDTSSNTSSDSSTSSTDIYNTVDISSIRSMEAGISVRVQGIVANMNYTGQATPYVTGFWLADETGSIYIYSEQAAQQVVKGYTVTLYGTKGYYIPDTDSGAAASTGYLGMQQLIDPEIVSVVQTISPIPESAINELTIAEIGDIPLTTDITGNIYRVHGRYYRYDNISFVNYSVYDLNRVDSLLAYTQCNGKDYYWTDDYDGKTVEMIIIVSLGKPGVGMWRMNPVTFIEEIAVSPLQEAEYGAERALNEIADVFDVETTKEIPINDELLEGLTREYSSESSKVAISQSGDNNVLVFHVDVLGTLELTATATYGGQSASVSKVIAIREPNEYDAISIAEAKSMADGEVVTIQAIVARVTYESSMTKQGLFLIDESGSLFVYNGDKTQANLAPIENGNKVVVTGTMTHYIKDATIAANLNFTGNVQLADVTVEHVDTNVYDLPTAAILDGSVEDVLATPPSINISSLIYKMEVSVSKVATQYFTNYYLDSLSSAGQLLLYSQNNGRDYEWLESYIGLEIEIYVGIQELNLKTNGSVWRSCAIAVVETA